MFFCTLLCANFDHFYKQSRAEVRRIIGIDEGDGEMIKQNPSYNPARIVDSRIVAFLRTEAKP